MPQELSTLDPSRCVWSMFKRKGAVSLLAQEPHGCEDAASVTRALARAQVGGGSARRELRRAYVGGVTGGITWVGARG